MLTRLTQGEELQLESEFAAVRGRVWTPHIVQPNDGVPDLFHYTDANGLLGILESSSLWATHFRSLNDSSEMQYAVDQALGLINALEESPKKSFLLNAMELLDAALPETEPYVVSFCDRGNLLSQWRAYGDRGSGFSISFDFQALSTLFANRNASVLKVTYDPRIQRHILRATFEAYWSTRLRWLTKCAGIEDRCKCELVSLLLTEFSAFKDPGFTEEQEWRLVRLGEGCSPRKFRTGRFGITPYIELTPPSGQKLPIRKVIQGPTADRSSAKLAAEMGLRHFGYDGVDVEVSGIPLR